MGKANIIIADLLGTGKRHAKHLSELSNQTGFDPITIKAMIKKERIAGTLIISDASGYYMAETRQEIADFIHWIESSAKSRHAILKPFKQALKTFDGQQDFLDYGQRRNISRNPLNLSEKSLLIAGENPVRIHRQTFIN